MSLIVIPLGINTMIGGAIWISELSIVIKVIITVLLVASFLSIFILHLWQTQISFAMSV